MKKVFIAVFIIALIGMQVFGQGTADTQGQSNYPEKNIQMVVGFPAGGGSDMTARSVTPLMEDFLDGTFVVTNMGGASGAIAGEYVLAQPADGYTLYFASETSANWPLNSITTHWYKDFEVIGLCARSVATIAVPVDSPLQTLDDFVKYVKANPGKLKQAGTGPATTGAIANAILKKGLGLEVTEIAYDGSNNAVVAVLGGHADVILENYFTVSEQYKAGKFRLLGVFGNERISTIPDVPALGEEYPDLAKYLPYGAWWGLYAPKGVSEDVIATLKEAFEFAISDKDWKASAEKRDFVTMELIGDEALEFIDKWVSSVAWIMYDLGMSKVNPESLGIPKN